MKNFLLGFLGMLIVVFNATAFAGETILETRLESPVLEDSVEKRFIIHANGSVEKGKNLILRAEGSPELMESVRFIWSFGDGLTQQGEEVVHAYNQAGEYQVSLKIESKNEAFEPIEWVQEVFVYEKNVTIISNIASKKDRLASFKELARDSHIDVQTIEVYTESSALINEEQLRRQILNQIQSLESSQTILVWTEGTTGLTVFSQLQKILTNKNFFQFKDIIFFTDLSFGNLENIARGVYRSTSPNHLILTRPEADWAWLESENFQSFLDLLNVRGVPYEKVVESLSVRPWNLFSVMVNSMIEHGMPTGTIQLVLMLSVIVTVVSFMKQIVGFESLGVYLPSILSLSFVALDLRFGLILFFAILISGSLARYAIRRYRLMYIPRMSIVMILSSFSILVMLYLGSVLEVSEIVGIAVFPMLMMTTIVEKFISLQSGQGFKNAVVLVFECLFVSILCYIVADWAWLKVFMLGHPEFVLVFLLINVFLARWNGLRWMEFIRFREIFKKRTE